MKRIGLLLVLYSTLILSAGCENKSYCPKGISWCWVKCVDLMNDNNNCGFCDNECGLHFECVDGVCTCMEGYSECDGKCVNLNFDRANCGACGNICDCDCIHGMCAGSCPHPYIVCDCECVDLEFDNDNCGACGNRCGTNEYCHNGKCCMQGGGCPHFICDVPNDCPDCVDLESSSDHCGACNNSCAEGMTCCQGSCTYTWADDENCGRCGNDCGEGSVCIDGACHTPCNGLWCGSDGCVNPDTNNAHCGECSNACNVQDDFVCQEGECTCISGLTECGDPPECVPLVSVEFSVLDERWIDVEMWMLPNCTAVYREPDPAWVIRDLECYQQSEINLSEEPDFSLHELVFICDPFEGCDWDVEVVSVNDCGDYIALDYQVIIPCVVCDAIIPNCIALLIPKNSKPVHASAESIPETDCN